MQRFPQLRVVGWEVAERVGLFGGALELVEDQTGVAGEQEMFVLGCVAAQVAHQPGQGAPA